MSVCPGASWLVVRRVGEGDTATAGNCTQHTAVLYAFPVENCREGGDGDGRAVARRSGGEGRGGRRSYSTTASDAQARREGFAK